MGYDISITRSRSNPIKLAEWLDAVCKIDGLRIATGNWIAKNPRTGDEVMLPNTGGDVEVYFEKTKEWLRVFQWADDGALFRARGTDMNNPTDPVRNAALKLAQILSAKVVGEAGEEYK